MAKQKFGSRKVCVNLGLFGLGDGEKSTLISAIAKFVNVSNPEPGAKHFEFEMDDRHYVLVDNSNLTEYMKNVATGAAQANAFIIVLPTTDLRTAQLSEFVSSAKQWGLSKFIVFLDNCGRVGDEKLLELMDNEIRSAFDSNKFDGSRIPIVHGFASGAIKGVKRWVDKIAELLKICNEYIPNPVADVDKPFLMPIEDVFAITGRGAGASGRVERGRVHLNDKVECLGFGKKKEYVVTGVEMFRKLLDEAVAGDNIGLLLRGAEKKDLARGMVVATPNTIDLYSEFDAVIYTLTKEEGGRHTPFFNGYRPQFYIRTTDVTGTIQIWDGAEMVMPGSIAKIHVSLADSMGLEAGLCFAIREGGRTVGVGVITRLGPTAVNPLMPEKQTFLMNVDDAFVITGRGTVITGSIVSGTIHTGDCVARVGSTTGYTVSSITVSSSVVNEAKAGDNVALLLRGVDKNAFARGNQITVLN